MVLHVGMHGLILEGDSLSIIEAMISREQNLTILGPLVIRLHHLLRRF